MKTFSPLSLALLVTIGCATADTRPCLSRIGSYESFRSTADTEWSLRLDGLTYFGAQHSSDPALPLFDDIRREWYALRPTVAFYEGPNRGVGSDDADTITRFGESGYVRFLAAGAKIPAKSLEPNPVDEMRAVTKEFPADQVALFYVLRETTRLRDRRGLEGDELRKAVAELIGRASKIEGMNFPLASLDDLQRVYATHFASPADWTAVPASWFDPLKSSAETGGKFTNDINRASSSFRNRHMAQLIAGAVNDGERVFAVVGRNHVPLQADAIRCLVAAQKRADAE